MQYLRSESSSTNDPEGIMISYDFQAGSYIKTAEANKEYFDKYTAAIERVLNKLGQFTSILEVGVGEATVMTPLLKKISKEREGLKSFGFDISWSRIHYAKRYSAGQNVSIDLFTGNLFNIPLPDNSVDIVYTSHSLEPNGGREKEALQELYRVASKYIVLLEPSFEFATDEGKARMESHGYIKFINKYAQDLGYKVIEHRLFDCFINPLNPTGLTIIEKQGVEKNEPELVCPITKSKLVPVKGVLYSTECLILYPVVDGIPCLLAENGILATHFNS